MSLHQLSSVEELERTSDQITQLVQSVTDEQTAKSIWDDPRAKLFRNSTVGGLTLSAIPTYSDFANKPRNKDLELMADYHTTAMGNSYRHGIEVYSTNYRELYDVYASLCEVGMRYKIFGAETPNLDQEDPGYAFVQRSILLIVKNVFYGIPELIDKLQIVKQPQVVAANTVTEVLKLLPLDFDYIHKINKFILNRSYEGTIRINPNAFIFQHSTQSIVVNPEIMDGIFNAVQSSGMTTGCPIIPARIPMYPHFVTTMRNWIVEDLNSLYEE